MTALPCLELADHASPFDEALIVIDGREEETIRIECPGARELAERLIRIVNQHDQVVQTLQMVSEVLRKFGAASAAVEIDKLKITMGDAA